WSSDLGARVEQVPVDVVAHQVPGAAPRGPDHWHAGRLGLLDRLAEGLELTGVAEDVEGRVGPPQLLAVQLPGEDGVRHRGPERGAVGPVAHDDQSEIDRESVV